MVPPTNINNHHISDISFFYLKWFNSFHLNHHFLPLTFPSYYTHFQNSTCWESCFQYLFCYQHFLCRGNRNFIIFLYWSPKPYAHTLMKYHLSFLCVISFCFFYFVIFVWGSWLNTLSDSIGVSIYSSCFNIQRCLHLERIACLCFNLSILMFCQEIGCVHH